MNNKSHFLFIKILLLFVIFIILFSPCSLAAYPKLVSTIVAAFETIKTWIIHIATPAAAVAVRYRGLYEKV